MMDRPTGGGPAADWKWPGRHRPRQLDRHPPAASPTTPRPARCRSRFERKPWSGWAARVVEADLLAPGELVRHDSTGWRRPSSAPGAASLVTERIAVVLAPARGPGWSRTLPKVLHRAGGPAAPRLGARRGAAAGCGRILVVVAMAPSGAGGVLRGGERGPHLGAPGRAAGHRPRPAQVEPTSERLRQPLLVLSGDVPLVTPGTLARLADLAAEGWAPWRCRAADPAPSAGHFGGSGVGRDPAADRRGARRTPEERQIRGSTPASTPCRRPRSSLSLPPLAAENAQGELYLTDALTDAVGRDGNALRLLPLADPRRPWESTTGASWRRSTAGSSTAHLETLMPPGSPSRTGPHGGPSRE